MIVQKSSLLIYYYIGRKRLFLRLKISFNSSKLIVKKKIKIFFGLRPKKIVRLLFTKFPIVLLDGLPKNKIVLLDGLSAKLSC